MLPPSDVGRSKEVQITKWWWKRYRRLAFFVVISSKSFLKGKESSPTKNCCWWWCALTRWTYSWTFGSKTQGQHQVWRSPQFFLSKKKRWDGPMRISSQNKTWWFLNQKMGDADCFQNISTGRNSWNKKRPAANFTQPMVKGVASLAISWKSETVGLQTRSRKTCLAVWRLSVETWKKNRGLF